MGFEAFCPYEKLTVRRARGRQSALVETAVPIFSRYCFVDADNLFVVQQARGVLGLVKAGEMLLRIPDAVVGALRAMAGTDDLCAVKDMTKPSLTFRGRVGQGVVLRQGSRFAGFLATIASVAGLDETGEIEAWITAFGREHRVSVPVDDVERLTLRDPRACVGTIEAVALAA